MKIPWTLTQMLLALALHASASEKWDDTKSNWSHLPPFESDIIEARLLQMESIVPVQFTDEVESYLRSYLTYGYRDAEKVLGNSLIYFPIFEYYLKLYNLPDALKFLPIIESNLNPQAISTAGAVGLWQLRSGIATHFGLQNNFFIDERRDPYRSTQAALKFLAKLYKQFGSWELALAAYNCGPSRVQRAIAAAGTRDFWKLRNFLPRETSNFIPRFIAAGYVINYHYFHGLSPEIPEFGRLRIQTVHVYDRLHFQEISDLTGLETVVIQRLNPMFKQGIVPANLRGNSLHLPESAAAIVKDVQKHRSENVPGILTENRHTVKRGDSLHKLAQDYNCTVEDLKRWNQLDSKIIHVGQSLVVGYFTCREIRRA